jgi:glucoamylase
VCWQVTARTDRIAQGRTLRLEFLDQANVHWSVDDWKTVTDSPTVATGLGLYNFDLSTEHLAGQTVIRFTIFWPQQNRWEGTDFDVTVIKAA